MKSLIPVLAAAVLATTAHATDSRVYGGQMPAGEALPVAEAIANPEAWSSTPGKFSGRITEVCQNMGCWVILEHDGEHARVAARDHAYGVPKDSSGRAVVFGTVEVRELSDEQVEHYERYDRQAGMTSRREVRIIASAIELLD